VIDFKDGITCIIGPNGSGKSNISDAMRWVLGEQSARALRGGRMEEIIFAGTDARRPKGMAEVTLVFDNAARVLDIDYSEVALKRRLYRSGESEYFINSNPCRLRDIRELLMDTGIGVDGYSFIGQGRVEKIVSDKPEMRREVFEEAAGIIKYKSKRAEAERKLDSASQNLARIGDIISGIEERIDSLREESEKAKEHAVLAARYRTLEINITLKNIESMQEKNKQLAAQFEEAGAALETLRREKSEADAKLSSLRARDTALEERADGVRDRLTAVRERVMGIENSALLTEERRKAVERDRTRLEAETAELAARIAAEEASLEKLAADRRGFETALAALNGELAGLLATAAEKEGAYTAKVGRIDELRAEMFERGRERAAKEAELASGESLFGSFDETETSIAAELSQGAEEQAALAKGIAGQREAAAAAAAEAETLGASVEAARGAYDKAVGAAADKRLEIEAVRLQSEKQSSRRRTLEEMEENYEGYASGVKALMKSRPQGVCGVVTELLKAEKGFETAIETALGARTQDIVCETDEDAKAAIRFLKENKAGRLTFLPVASIRGREPFSASALDHVSFDEKYRGVFEYLLGRTVIADTLDDAVALSKNNKDGAHIVTKDGEVINPAGALTGGAYRNKSANLLERRNEIEALREETAALAAKGETLKEELEALQAQGEALLAEIREGDATLREKEAERIRAESDLKAAEARLADVGARLARRQAELEGVRKDRSDSSGMLETLRAEIETLAAEGERIRTETEAETAGLTAAKEESERAAEAATVVRLRAAEAGRDKENADMLQAAAEEGLHTLRASLAAKREELEGLAGVFTEVSDEEAGAELAKLSEEAATLETSLEQAVEERREVRRQIEEAELASERGTDKIEAAVSAKTGMEVELGRQETRLATWKEKLFEEFELSYVHALEYRDPDFVMSRGMAENREVKERLRELGEVNPGSIREYEETSERYGFLTKQRDDVFASMKDFQDIVRDMDKISREKFRETFDRVSETFAETFALLFGGGKGEISLEGEGDPLESGIDIKIRPPGKTNLASIDSYSGGEKSMIAIALLFSILKAKPTPFCVLDEIDAALDETNIHRFAQYVANFKETQFALVTHQRSTMEYADALFGVTMQEQGVTTVLSLLLGEKETEAFAETLN
jgi:chromosome segregation protein